MPATTSHTVDPSRYGNLTVLPISEALGAEIKDVDLAKVDDATYRGIRNAWIDNLVLLFRNQSIDDAELVAFSRLFGELDMAPPQENGLQAVVNQPEIMVISNVKEGGVPIGSLGDGEAIWHTDMNYAEYPPLGSALFSLEVPDMGGNTGFCNMYMALEALPADLRAKLEGKSIKHDASMTSGGYLRHGMDEVTDVSQCPGAIHPIIRNHPESNRSVLYLGRRLNAYVMNMPIDESEALLDEIWQYTTLEHHTWHHQWQVGDVVFWDNRAVMHRRDAFDSGQRRIMHRTQIADRPTA
ncbi:MAG: TauD/TfdA family dioxygenase [Pseudomonadota bacterium]|nr:TauD/TfdA family dioxygenase [Pseudomonadota bacterium]